MLEDSPSKGKCSRGMFRRYAKGVRRRGHALDGFWHIYASNGSCGIAQSRR